MDLASGYWQVALTPEDKMKTAFSTTQGHFEFNVMPFGMYNSLAPATFRRLMECVLARLRWGHCLHGIYLDDIIAFTKTFQDHLKKLRLCLSIDYVQ